MVRQYYVDAVTDLSEQELRPVCRTVEPPAWDADDLSASPVGQSLAALKEAGYDPVGFRLVRYFNRETGEHLTADEAQALPQHQVFQWVSEEDLNQLDANLNRQRYAAAADLLQIDRDLVQDSIEQLVVAGTS